jgi:HSP20 family molecular chaperone IbpA
MTTFFDFAEFFGDFGFSGGFMKSMLREFNDIEKMVKSGKLKGKWGIKQIDEPGRKGYVIQGRFWSNQPIEPFEPFKPWRRRPMPKRPFEVPEKALKEIREPLTDVFEEDKTVKIYVELPGEEEGDIQLKVVEGKVEVKAKKFYKIVEVPTSNVDIEKASSKYKNGVLEVTIPKKDKSPLKID